MVIMSPQKYAGRTLEGHLRLYDWKNEFYTFERTIKTSSFDELCNSAYVPSKVEENPSVQFQFRILNFLLHFAQIIGFPPNITKPYRPPDTVCPPRDTSSTYKLIRTDDIGENLIDDNDKGKAIRSNPSTFSLELSSSSERVGFSFSLFSIFTFFHILKLIKQLSSDENQNVS